jgi:hypothetical protein
MLAKAKAATLKPIEASLDAIADELLDEVVDEMSPASDGPPKPPIEVTERQPRRRKHSNLRYYDEHLLEGGIDWTERVAIACPGYRIVGIKHRTSPGHRGRFTVLTRRIETNGGGNG